VAGNGLKPFLFLNFERFSLDVRQDCETNSGYFSLFRPGKIKIPYLHEDYDLVLFHNFGQFQEEICVFICTGEVKIPNLHEDDEFVQLSCFTILVNSKGKLKFLALHHYMYWRNEISLPS
jgi:hypothetical protein